MKKFKQLKEDLLDNLIQLKDETTDIIYFNTIVNWVKENKSILSKSEYFGTILNMFLKLDANLYLNNHPLDLHNKINMLKNWEINTIDGIVMNVLDEFVDIICIFSDEVCPCCESGTIYWKDSNTGRLFLECVTCTWFQSKDKKQYIYDMLVLVPATKEEVK